MTALWSNSRGHPDGTTTTTSGRSDAQSLLQMPPTCDGAAASSSDRHHNYTTFGSSSIGTKVYGAAETSFCSAASTCSSTSSTRSESCSSVVGLLMGSNIEPETTTTANNDDKDNHNNHEKQPTPQQPQRSTLSTLQLATIIFYSVSGGPFGIEESVRSAGPFYTIVGFLIAPLIFSVPECLMTIELSTAEGFQSSAAGCAWAEEAFGPRAGFLTGYWNWVSGATDNAIYPVLFLDYALQIFPIAALQQNNNNNPDNDHDDSANMWRFTLITTISMAMAYMNWCGLDLVGNMSIMVCCIAMSPFVIFVVWGACQVDPQRWFRLPSSDDFVFTMEQTMSNSDNATSFMTGNDDDDNILEAGFLPNLVWGGVLLRPLLNNLFWNYNSFDNAGSVIDEIQHPVSRVFPRAMFLGFLGVVVGYLLPLLVALGTTDAPPDQWTDGYLATVVSETVGPWLGVWLVVAAALSNLGQFQAELSSDAYLLMGMAERGHLPKFLATRSSKTGTPTYSLLVGTVVIVIMGVSNLDDLIEMLNFNYALALILEYAAFIKLRISKPDVSRPCRVPLSTTGCVVALLPTFAALSLVIALASYTTICVNIVTTSVGVLIYTFMERSRSSSSRSAGNEEGSTTTTTTSPERKNYESVMMVAAHDCDDTNETPIII